MTEDTMESSYLFLLTFIPLLFITTPVLAHTKAFTAGFKEGITNENESHCNVSGDETGLESVENDCRSGFVQGQLELMQSTPQYQFGLMAGRHDSIIANSTDDAHECNIYTNIFQYNSCAKGFDSTYHYSYKGPLAIIATTTVHCNANDNASNSCYHLGENDGIYAATALIKICHRGAPQNPTGHHSFEYVLGFRNGWQNANTASENSDGSYGTNNCKV
jgi:hypothetical protein